MVYKFSSYGQDMPVVVDIESTGIYPGTNAIASLGAFDLGSQKEYYQEFRVPKGCQITDESLSVNGFTKEQLFDSNKPLIADALPGFLRWVNDLEEITMAGWNVHFDVGFLRKDISDAGLKWPFSYRHIDVHSIVYAFMEFIGYDIPTENKCSVVDLDDGLEFVGLGNIKTPHTALEDAKLEAEVYHRIVFEKPLLKAYQEMPIPNYILS